MPFPWQLCMNYIFLLVISCWCQMWTICVKFHWNKSINSQNSKEKLILHGSTLTAIYSKRNFQPPHLLKRLLLRHPLCYTSEIWHIYSWWNCAQNVASRIFKNYPGKKLFWIVLDYFQTLDLNPYCSLPESKFKIWLATFFRLTHWDHKYQISWL